MLSSIQSLKTYIRHGVGLEEVVGMIGISVAAMLGNDQAVVLAQRLDLVAVRGPQRGPSVGHNNDFLGSWVDVKVSNVEFNVDGSQTASINRATFGERFLIGIGVETIGGRNGSRQG